MSDVPQNPNATPANENSVPAASPPAPHNADAGLTGPAAGAPMHGEAPAVAIAEPGGPEQTPLMAPPAPVLGLHWGTGRRKSAVARVRLTPGSGIFMVNERPVETFFTELQDRADAVAPLDLTGVRRQWDVHVNVNGGGHTGQAGAIKLGLARAMLKAYVQFEPQLRDAGFLTRDARRVERKKYGQRKARRRFQFSKR